MKGPYRQLLVITVDVTGDEQRETQLREQFAQQALVTTAGYYNLPPTRDQVDITVEGDRWMSLDDFRQFAHARESDVGTWEAGQLTRIFLNLARAGCVQCANYVRFAEGWSYPALRKPPPPLRPYPAYLSASDGVDGLLLLLSDLQDVVTHPAYPALIPELGSKSAPLVTAWVEDATAQLESAQ